MRIAVVLPVPWLPAHFTGDPRWLIDGILKSGHDGILVCATGSKEPPGVPLVIARNIEFESAAFWMRLRPDMAIVFTWMTNFLGTLSALRRAGVFVVSKGDTDGLLGVRVRPRETFVRTVYSQRTTFERARGVWHWAKKYAVLYKDEDSRLLANLATADATLVESRAARDNLLPLLEYYGAVRYWDRIHAIPNAVSQDIAHAPVLSQRERRVVSVGRWEDPQKNVHLLRRTIDRALKRDSTVSFVVVGPGSEGHFSGAGSRVECIGYVPHEEMRSLLSRGRILLITSRWEGFPNTVAEALALGCSIVGTDIPAVREVAGSREFGRVGGRTSRGLAIGLDEELRSWDQKMRDPREIAAYWRERLAPEKVVGRITELRETMS
jgi:glycosyltransferase involved in cell wall biosynthesis